MPWRRLIFFQRHGFFHGRLPLSSVEDRVVKSGGTVQPVCPAAASAPSRRHRPLQPTRSISQRYSRIGWGLGCGAGVARTLSVEDVDNILDFSLRARLDSQPRNTGGLETFRPKLLRCATPKTFTGGIAHVIPHVAVRSAFIVPNCSIHPQQPGGAGLPTEGSCP